MTREQMITFVMKKNNMNYTHAAMYVDTVILGVK